MAARFDLGKYVEVAERIRAFYEKYPEGSIQTEMVRLEDGLVVFRASVFRDATDPLPTTGWAYEREGSSPVNRTSFVENCETSAIGRALANRDFAGTRRPSREEMEKVARMQAEWRETATTGAPKAPGAIAETPEDRVRALLRQMRLAPAKRQRIEAKLEGGITEQEAQDLEAYLLAVKLRAS